MESMLMPQPFEFLAAIIAGILVGVAMAWLLLRFRIQAASAQAKNESQIEFVRLNERLGHVQEDLSRVQAEFDGSVRQARQLQEQLTALREKFGAAEMNVSNQSEQIKQLTRDKHVLTQQCERLLAEQNRLGSQLAETGTALEAERRQGEEKLQLLNDAREQLSNQFKALASEILEEKSRRFTEQNQTNISGLLEPLKVKLHEFQGKVEEVYVQEGKDRSALAEQVKQLLALNNQLSQDAHNLTKALKGQSKVQGNWGELILERVLESSGLTKGLHYQAQQSHGRDDGSRAQPDVIINLPEGRHLVVDAKVSLTAYEEYVSADTDLGRDAALRRHLDSVRSHIKGLSGKNYQDLYQLKSLDFVLMFIAVEPAFMLAISEDQQLWQDAWKQNVLLVSPSTLLFVVRTVAHLWRQEQQNRNAQEIAKRGGDLYDKLAGFAEDMQKLGERLNQARDSYDKALGKLSRGRGNLLGQAIKLKELGIKPSKSLPHALAEWAQDEESSPE